MHTSGFSCHIPAVDIIKGALLETFYLVDVFHMVYEAICAPPPILLGFPLNSELNCLQYKAAKGKNNNIKQQKYRWKQRDVGIIGFPGVG